MSFRKLESFFYTYHVRVKPQSLFQPDLYKEIPANFIKLIEKQKGANKKEHLVEVMTFP